MTNEMKTAIEDHKWLDPECGMGGCQSLVWKSRYESAVEGRQDFRKAYRDAREDNKVATGVLRTALQFLEGTDPLLTSGGVRNMDLRLGIRATLASTNLDDAAVGEGEPTPGPITLVSDPHEDGAPYFRLISPDGYYSAETGKGFDISGTMSEADAHRFAASPQMFDALKQALLYIETDEIAHGRQFGDGNVVRAAIAKAEGRS